MTSDSIYKMVKSNAKSLDLKHLNIGLNRFKLLEESNIKHYIIETDLSNNRFHIRLSAWISGKYKLLARIGDSKSEAKAKLGLSFPIKYIK